MLYPHLFTPLDLGSCTLLNRVLMGSMRTSLEDRAGDFPKLAAYFAEREAGDVGLTVTGGFAPNVTGWLKPMNTMLRRGWQSNRHRPATDAVHAHGARICPQSCMRATTAITRCRSHRSRSNHQSIRPSRAR